MSNSTTRQVLISWREFLDPSFARGQESVSLDERAASAIASYNNYVITGLLQTHAYALAIVAGVIQRFELPDDPEEAAAARIARQEVLNDPGKTFQFVLHENALYTQVGSPEIMVKQMDRLEHLTRQTSAANVTFGILPNLTLFDAGLPTRSFSMYGDVATEEAIGGALTITDPLAVADYHRAYNLAAECAVRGIKAAELIDKAREHWRKTAAE